MSQASWALILAFKSHLIGIINAILARIKNGPRYTEEPERYA